MKKVCVMENKISEEERKAYNEILICLHGLTCDQAASCLFKALYMSFDQSGAKKDEFMKIMSTAWDYYEKNLTL